MPWTRMEQFPVYGRIEPLCSVCHSPQRILQSGPRANLREDVFDTGTEIEMEGNFVICETCMTEASHLLGFIPPEKAEDLRQQLEAQAEVITEAKQVIDDKEVLNASLVRELERKNKEIERLYREIDRASVKALMPGGTS